MVERVSATGEEQLLGALRAGDEDAFRELVRRHTASMTRVALAFVSRRAVAEEIVQETWLNVLRGLDGFEGRSTLRTWIFVVLGNCARRRAGQEARAVPMSTLAGDEAAGDDGDAPAGRFFDPGHPRWAGMWSTCVENWDTLPERQTLDAELRSVVAEAIERLPRIQRAVITLRDVEGWPADEVCDLLAISDGNQRILLHRARGAVRAVVESYLREG